MAKADSTVAIEFDTPINSNVRFAPLQRTIRGKFDINRVAEPNAGQLRSRFPEPIPGQRIEYDFATETGYVCEPLHEARYSAIRDRIEAMGMGIGKEREPFACDAATFRYWASGLVETGDAKLTGTLPAVAGKPRTRFHSAEQVDAIDRLAAAIERQADGQNQTMLMLVAAIEKLAASR